MLKAQHTGISYTEDTEMSYTEEKTAGRPREAGRRKGKKRRLVVQGLHWDCRGGRERERAGVN